MANQYNDNIPAVSNTIIADIVDIEETLGFFKDAFEQIGTGWSDSTVANYNIKYSVNDVRYYGAVGDGTTDDAAAIKSAIESGENIVFPYSADGYAIKSDVVITLTKDTLVDFNNQRLIFTAGQIKFQGTEIATGLTLAANADRYAKTVTLDDASDALAGDLVYISTTIAPSSDWTDTKKDLVRISSISEDVLTLDEGLNFAYTTGDAGLDILIYRPVKLTLVRPQIELVADDEDTTPYYCIYCLGLRDINIIEPTAKGGRPFSRSTNIYRTGIILYRCWGANIIAPFYDSMSYPIGVYGGSRNIYEISAKARYCHHSHADMGDWCSHYILNGLESSDGYQSLNTHACFNAYASNFIIKNDFGLSTWRVCGGGIRDGIIASTTDDDDELPQFQNNTPNAGYEYINTDADFYCINVDFQMPSRAIKPSFAVRYGRNIYYERVKGLTIGAGLVASEIAKVIIGPGCEIGTDKLSHIPEGNNYAALTRYDVRPMLAPIIASAGALVIPAGLCVAFISGTTNVTSITSSAGNEGQRVTLIFTDELTFTDGNNLALAGNFATTSGDTITLVCGQTNWYEVCRSAN